MLSRRIWRLGFAVLGVVAGASWSGRLPAAEPSPLVAGAYAQDITPPQFPISVNGNMGDVQAMGAHDPLHARCLVLANQSTQLAIVIVDSCMIPRPIIDSAKERIAYRTGIAADHIVVAATHSHTCPTVTGVFQSEPNSHYVQFLSDRIVEGVERAWKQREPAKVGFGAAVNDTQLFNRRWRLKDSVIGENPFGQKVDRVRMNPGYSSPDVTTQAGPVDPQVSVLAVQARDGRPLALLANYSLHYVGGVGAVSADYFGEFAVRVTRLIGGRQAHPNFVAMLSNGTSADVNNVNFSLKSGSKREPFEQISVVAESVAQTAFQAYQQIAFTDSVALDGIAVDLELGVRRPSPEELAQAEAALKAIPDRPLKGTPPIYARESVLLAEYPATVRTPVQALRIGELAITTSPCETFTETGLAIKASSPFQHTFTIELANGYNGYLPTPQQHRWGGYETWRARSSYLATDAEPQIRSTLWDLLHQLRSR